MRFNRDNLIVALATCIIIIFTASCTNLKAVREWSKTSIEATQYSELVTTYVDTPRRLMRYDSDFNGMQVWTELIAIRMNQADALKQMLAVVSDYMLALATLSDESIINYKEDVNALTNGLNSLNIGIKAETVGAAGSIVAILGSAAAGIYQAKQVEKIVEQANQPLQLILKSELREIVNTDFRQDLNAEMASLDRYYDSLLQTSKSSPAAVVALTEWKEARIQKNKERMEVVDAYLSVLDNLANGHQKLYDNKNKLDAKNLAKDLYSLVGDLRKQIKILTKS